MTTNRTIIIVLIGLGLAIGAYQISRLFTKRSPANVNTLNTNVSPSQTNTSTNASASFDTNDNLDQALEDLNLVDE